MAAQDELQEKILTVLREVKDPELQRDIVSLGMLKGIKLEEDKATVSIEMTSPSESLKAALKQEIEKKLSPNFP